MSRDVAKEMILRGTGRCEYVIVVPYLLGPDVRRSTHSCQ